MTTDDETQAKLRRELIMIAVDRVAIALMSINEDAECVVIGKVVKVTKHHVVIASTRSFEQSVPLASVTSVKRLDESKPATVVDEPKEVA
jgi:hypothetical protein